MASLLFPVVTNRLLFICKCSLSNPPAVVSYGCRIRGTQYVRLQACSPFYLSAFRPFRLSLGALVGSCHRGWWRKTPQSFLCASMQRLYELVDSLRAPEKAGPILKGRTLSLWAASTLRLKITAMRANPFLRRGNALYERFVETLSRHGQELKGTTHHPRALKAYQNSPLQMQPCPCTAQEAAGRPAAKCSGSDIYMSQKCADFIKSGWPSRGISSVW